MLFLPVIIALNQCECIIPALLPQFPFWQMSIIMRAVRTAAEDALIQQFSSDSS